jgi:hypothetical protein
MFLQAVFFYTTDIRKTKADSSILDVDELQNLGINAADIQKLRAAGIYAISVHIYANSALLIRLS